MLKKRNRLSRREFEHLLKHGRRVHGDSVTIVFEKLAACSLQGAGASPNTSTPPLPSLQELSTCRPLHFVPCESARQVLRMCPAHSHPIRGRGASPETCKLKPVSSPALRAGVVVGKKVARNAVDRNKLRREIYRILGEELSLTQALHLAILTRPNARMMTPDELRREIRELLARFDTMHNKIAHY